MIRDQYDAFLKKHNLSRYQSDIAQEIMVSPKKGAHQGKKLRLLSIETSSLTMSVSEDKSIKLPYSAVDELDENGEVVVAPILDMTGRTIVIGDYICYSQSAGNSSHCLSIGKVLDITPTGGLRVKRIIRDGVKHTKNSWVSDEHALNDPARCLKIPIDSEVMVLWVLTDFDEATRNKVSSIAPY